MIKLDKLSEALELCDNAAKKGIETDDFKRLKQRLFSLVQSRKQASLLNEPPQSCLQDLVDLCDQKLFKLSLDKANQLLSIFLTQLYSMLLLLQIKVYGNAGTHFGLIKRH